ncbi:RICIN domain-containing protein [Streptomyces polygonati]|uniref:RICIN domain-containing protein n=1 Tax=Streptomyces polygonati TaxID=1617087 RepID=A0ABV8HU45_9ACTN
MSTKKILRWILAVAATVLFTVSSSGAARADAEALNLINLTTGRCMAVPASSEAPGTQIAEWQCSSNRDQDWELNLIAGTADHFQIRNANSDLCLAMPGSSKLDGEQAIQWTCEDDHAEQTWTMDSWGRLWNLNSQRCLAVPNSDATNNTPIIQWPCTDNYNERWLWTGDSTAATYARLFNQGTGYCLAYPNQAQVSGVTMIQWDCSYSETNFWGLISQPGGGFHVVNQATDECLALGGASTSDGSEVIQWPCGDGAEQVWYHDGYQLINENSNKCLTIPSLNNAAKAIQETCSGAKDQQWLW